MKPDQDQPLPRAAQNAQRELDRAIGQVQTPQQAEMVLQEAREKERSSRAPEQGDAADVVARAARKAGAEGEETAPMNRAVEQTTSGQRRRPIPPKTAHGLDLLRRAVFKRLGPAQKFDLSAYLAINHLPHPPGVDRWMSRLSWAMTGGFGWLPILVVSLVAERRSRPAFARTVWEIVPSLWLATATVEHPIKRFFRRERPFVDSVRAIVVGRKPGSFSFPSGHSAAAFAGAVLLSRRFPRWRVIYYALAALTAFSRTYLGAHYPGDVVTGSMAGAGLARGYLALLRRLFRRSG